MSLFLPIHVAHHHVGVVAEATPSACVEKFCPSLPSSEYAYRLVSGDMTAIPGVIGTTAFRAALIALGIYAFGVRDNIVRNSIAGAVTVEAFVVGWLLFKASKEKALSA